MAARDQPQQCQWRVCRADDKWFESEPLLWPEAVVPVNSRREVLPCTEGWRRARVTTAKPFRSAWQTVVVGGLAAAAAFLIAKAVG